MASELELSSHHILTTLQRNRRQRQEAELSRSMDPLAASLMPLSVSIARLSARTYVVSANGDEPQKE